MGKRTKPKERMDHWKKRIEENPDSASAHYNLGLVYTQVGKMTSAENAYRRAVELDPELLEAWVNLAGTLLLQWRFEECLEASERAAALADDLPVVHFNMGQAHLYLGESDKVVLCNRKVLELEPNHPAATYFLAVGLLAQGKVSEARFYMERAMRLGHRPTPEFMRALERAKDDGVRLIEVGN